MPVKVTNEAILNLLRNVSPEPLTNAEIRDALDYSKDDTIYLSARLAGMVNRHVRTGVSVTMKGERKAWRIIAPDRFYI